MRKLKRLESFYGILIGRGRFLRVFVLLTLFSCKGPETEAIKAQKYFDVDTIYTDYLVSFSDDSVFAPGESCGYVNSKGEIIISAGKYNHCFTDTFRNFAYISDEKLTNSKIVAIDRNENILFHAYMFDNGPDWMADDLFRIMRNGKIGFADKNGVVIIEPIYECADQFLNGISRVALNCKNLKEQYDSEHTRMESDSWFYIDKKGNRVK